MEEYNEGDLIAVFGGKSDRDSCIADAVSFCKVMIVGQDDLVVQNTLHYATNYHVVPKSVCLKLYLRPEILSSAETLVPKIGDLVASFSRVSDGVDKKTGILCKVLYRLGRPDRCELLCGTETVAVNWSSIIVLRR